jgi:small subunit ribosomal protein S23
VRRVVQRQAYLMTTGVPSATAYNIALKEFAAYRHALETSTRVAREEALATGAFFGAGPLEIGMKLEDQQYESWRKWAEKEIEAAKQLQGSAYTGQETEGVEESQGLIEEAVEEVAADVPQTKRGQEAKGGAAVHP